MTDHMRDGAILRAMTSGPVTRAVSRHFCLVVILYNVFLTVRTFAGEAPLKQIKLSPGFEIAIFADNVRDARSMVLSPKGTVFVGTRGAGKVYALPAQAEKNASGVITVAEGLKSPNGVAFHNGALYVAEISRVLRYDNIEARLNSPPKPVIVSDSFPTEGTHGWKFIAFGPDGLLLCRWGRRATSAKPTRTVMR
jgi:glucose/arabinose dehydrogenase